MGERIIILGAGIAGLGAALALGGRSHDVTIIERDPSPPELSINEVFASWERKGATQIRHSHVFLGRLCRILRTDYPDLFAELLAAGARELPFDESLPSPIRPHYVAKADDRDMSFLFIRRTTLEYVMRRYVVARNAARFVNEAGVIGLLTKETKNGLSVIGVRVRNAMGEYDERADIVIDATGRNGAALDWLRVAGAEITEETSSAGILYYTRHYALLPGQQEPDRDGTAGAGDLGYLKYGVFPADNGHFSITLALPEIEIEMRKIIVNPDIFDTICNELPGVRRWLEPMRSAAVSKVFAMGNLANVWRSFVRDGNPQALGYFAIGDAALRTNPLYGRGCSIGVISAHMLADILAETQDPTARAIAYDKRLRAELRPFLVSMARLDAMAIRRARNERNPAYRPHLRARIIRHLADNAIVPATRGNLKVLRAFMRGFHMYEAPENWLKHGSVLARVLIMWMTPRPLKRHLYPPYPGPARDAMLRLLLVRQ